MLGPVSKNQHAASNFRNPSVFFQPRPVNGAKSIVPGVENQTEQDGIEQEFTIQRAQQTCNILSPVRQNILPSINNGQSLSKQQKEFFGPAFGNLDAVRIHTGEPASHAAQALHARAFTSGNNIVFNKAEYAPGTSEGKRLMAHELTHVVQQAGNQRTIQRAPLPGDNSSTAGLHEDLLKQYMEETGTPAEIASPYSADYSRWLRVRSGNNVVFLPPVVVKANPLTRRKNQLSEGFTELLINGRATSGNTLGDLITNMVSLIKPASTETNMVSGNRWVGQFDQNFKIKTSTKVTEATAPGQAGWNENMLPSTVLLPADQRKFNCGSQSAVPVTLRGLPTDNDYAQIVHRSEMEHVNELKILHQRHFVPYYNFIMGLKGVGNSAAASISDLNTKVNKMDEQAATAFILADMAETRKYDDPASTHHSSLVPTVAPNCASITLTASINNQQPNLAPGNVRTVRPAVTNINAANLTVTGSSLTEGGRTIRQFSQAQIAQEAMRVLQHYNVTTINRIGPFTYLLSGANAPAGPLQGVNELEIDPDHYQVTVGMPGINDWVISEIKGDEYFSIIDFGAARDQAYSSVDIMRRMRFTNQAWIGSANNTEFGYFRVD